MKILTPALYIAPVMLLGACTGMLGNPPERLLNEGLTLSTRNQHDQALVKYKQATLTDARAAAWNNVGVTLARTGQWKASLKAYTQALAHQPDLAVSRFNRGVANLRLKRYPQAERDFRAAVTTLRKFPKAWNNLGIALLHQKRYKAAASALRHSISLEASTARTWNNLGAALRGQGKRFAAKLAFQRALSIEPGYDKARRNLRALASR